MEGQRFIKGGVNGQKKASEWKKVKAPKQKVEKKIKKFGKGEREIKKKLPRAFVDGARKASHSKKIKKPNPTHLKKGIVPGTVLILLSGPFRGRRVVFLKQLPSGLLLVTGPYRINGVPVRRVNQAYVIATSTHIGINFKIPDTFDDKYFKKPKEKKKKAKPEDAFEKKKQEGISASRKDDQKIIDNLVLPLIKKQPLLRHYLKGKFTLSKHTFPHLMKF